MAGRYAYDAASEKDDRSQTVKPRHDEVWDGVNPDGSESNEGDKDGESASKSTVGSGSRD